MSQDSQVFLFLFLGASQSYNLWYDCPSLPHWKHLSLRTNPFMTLFLCPPATHAKALLVFAFCADSSLALVFGTTCASSGHHQSLMPVNSCFSAQPVQNFYLDDTITIFCTSSRRITFQFMYLLSGDTVTSNIGHLMPISSRCNLTELPEPLHSIPPTFLIVEYFHPFSVTSSICIPTTFCPRHSTCPSLPLFGSSSLYQVSSPLFHFVTLTPSL